jgi:hypothetical protein
MTMHRAKGLEFDHVMLYGLGRMPGSGGSSVLSWFDIPSRHGGEQKIISPIGPRAVVERDPVHRYIAAVAAEKDAHELGRLIYVACTRAQKSLHIVGNVALTPDGSDYRPARSDSLLHRLWPAVEREFASAFDGWNGGDGAAVGPPYIVPQRRLFTSSWSLPDARALPGVLAADEHVAVDDEVEFYWVGTEARIAGTLAHRWLECLAANRDAACNVQDVSMRWLREIGVGGAAAEAIAARVEQAVSRVLGDDRGRWLLDGPGHAELALTGLHDGDVTSIVVDRIRVDENGDHWLVDYKTSTHEGGNLAGFLEAEIERYTPQLEKYAAIYGAWAGVTPRCALYFPLLAEFVEVAH